MPASRTRAYKAVVLSALAACVAGQASTPCSFQVYNMSCVSEGGACYANGNRNAVAKNAAAPSPYSPAFCKVNSGSGLTAQGVVATSPTFRDVYGSRCSPMDPYSCQYADVTVQGSEYYPGMLSCQNSQCLFRNLQEHGDPCLVNSECSSNQCVAGMCHGLPLGALCKPAGCATGMHCYKPLGSVQGSCVADSGVGEACNAFGQCVQGSECNTKQRVPTCVPLFSLPNGANSSNADLCESGFTDVNSMCVALPNPILLSTPCDGSVPAPAVGTECFCASDNTKRIRPATLRDANMVAARKAARTCINAATAPDGTRCGDPWENVGAGIRFSDMGTCAFLQCHDTFMAWYGSQGYTLSPKLKVFDHSPACAQNIAQAFYSNAASNGVPCDLPSVWASLGWKCNTAYDKPAGPGGMSPGGAAALSIFIIALVAFLVWAVWALKMRRAPKWLVSAAAWLDNCWTGVKDRTRLNSMRARPIVFTSSSAAPIISSSSSGSGSDAERASILRG